MGLRIGRVRIFREIEHDPVIALAAAVAPQKTGPSLSPKRHLVEKGEVKFLERIDRASCFEQQHFHAGFAKLHRGPSAACARADYDRVIPHGAPDACTPET